MRRRSRPPAVDIESAAPAPTPLRVEAGLLSRTAGRCRLDSTHDHASLWSDPMVANQRPTGNAAIELVTTLVRMLDRELAHELPVVLPVRLLLVERRLLRLHHAV